MKETDPRRKLRLVRRAMLRRCCDPSDPDFRLYGARGIALCPEWQEAPKAFTDWALDNGYRPGLYLDRIDNAKGYSPSNCRWVTPQQSVDNRRCTIKITFKRRTMTLRAWSEALGINVNTLYSRYRNGLPPARILALTP